MKNKAMQQTENKQNILFKRKQNNETDGMGILNKYNLISIILNKYKNKLECWKHKAETGNYNLKIFSVKNI